jgi:catechol 2,3-dioxygenase-like lactoylglutathione lyase family enzyme
MGSLFGRTRARFGQIVAGFSRLASYKATGESSGHELARQSMSRSHIDSVTASGAESCRRRSAPERSVAFTGCRQFRRQDLLCSCTPHARARSPQGSTAILYRPRLVAIQKDDVVSEWFARPVLFVADIGRSVDFYVKQLGFTQIWRHEEEGKALVAQVDRQGCALILSSQWPDKVGSALMFISLDVDVLLALRGELEAKGVSVKDGYWGYPLMIVQDLDGNELYFPYPNDAEALLRQARL